MKSSRSFTGSRQCVGSVSLHKEHQMQLIRQAREANNMREPECYREILESLLTASKGKRILSQSDVARHLNKSRGWVIKRLKVGRDGIAVEALAMKLAKEFV